MHLSATVLFSFSLALATGALADSDSDVSHLGLRTKPMKISKRAAPPLLDTRESCQGTCQACFGPTFVDCPDNKSYCYDPTLSPASEQCSGGSSSSTRTTSATPTATATTETCFQKGATCESCFGSGSVNCPSGSYYDCYEPAQHSEAEGCKIGAGTSTSSRSIIGAPSSTTALGGFLTSSSAVNTSTRAGGLGAGSSDSTSSSASRIIRPSPSSSSTSTRTGTSAIVTSSAGPLGSAPALLGKDTGAFAALAAGLLALMGLL